MKLVINGSFLVEAVMGVQRYALEITKELDRLYERDKCGVELEIAVPQSYEGETPYRNIQQVKLPGTGGRRWEQTSYAKYLKKNNAKQISLCNSVPLLAKGGIACVHDICFKTHREFFTQKGDWHEILFRKLMYRRAFRTCDTIITVSNAAKKEILDNYRLKNPEIIVAGNGWQHYTTDDCDETIFEDKRIVKGEYYFFLASLAMNKNLSWIIENARLYPERTYVLAGKPLGESLDRLNLPNVIYAGFVSDGQAKALMKYCRAFLFPSFYEGFGIPPMEALCMGARIVISDIECLREIYKEAAYYINPYDATADVEKIISSPADSSASVLSRYSWENSARKIYAAITDTYKNI